jgi:ABC-2 type transport system permease protein
MEMAATTISMPNATLPIAYTARLYSNEVKYEFLKLFRNKGFTLSTIGFPIMFYILFGVANRHYGPDGFNYARYLLASYSCVGMIGTSLFGIGVGLAIERAQGWLEVKQASPMPTMAYLLAKLVTCMAFAVVIVSGLILLGTTFAGVHLSVGETLRLYAITICGAIPFASMGLLLGLLLPANAAPGIVNLIYLPMSFCSGLWMPIEVLPRWLQKVAPFLPAYHFGQLGLNVLGYARNGSMAPHWEAMGGFTMLFLGLTWLVFSRRAAKA